jgi:RNA polymerase sigma-70 factor (ECF subfamily)
MRTVMGALERGRARAIVESAPARSPGLEELLAAYAPYVARIGYNLLGRSDEVDDLVQDVFLAALSGLHRLREPGAAKAWLATTAVRIARRRLRMRRLGAFIALDDETRDRGPAAPGASPEQGAIFARFLVAIDRLPVRERVAWCLRYLQGEDLARVAELCGCSLATAKRRIAAAHETLRRELDGE